MTNCFLSYAYADRMFVHKTIYPFLRRNMRVLDSFELSPEDDVISHIVKGVQNADVIVCVFSSSSYYVGLETAAAFGANKPIIALVNNNLKMMIPRILQSTHIIWYSENNVRDILFELDEYITIIKEQVIDKVIFHHGNKIFGNKILGISVGNEFDDFELELRFTIDFIDFIKTISPQAQISLIQPAKGSLKNLMNIDLKSWAELIEKIIFIIPELKKRKTDRMKVEAEIKKINAETRQINVETDIKQAEAFANLLEKYQELGIKIQIDDDLLITQNANGMLTFKRPEALE